MLHGFGTLGLCVGLLQVLDQAQQDRVAELIAEEGTSSPERPASPPKNQVGQLGCLVMLLLSCSMTVPQKIDIKCVCVSLQGLRQKQGSRSSLSQSVRKLLRLEPSGGQ